MTLQHAKILNANLVVNVKKVSSTLMVNASSPHHVHASMLVKVTKLVKLSTLNVKTAFVMLVVLSAVLINRAGELVQFSEILISLHLIISDLISKEHAATFSLAQQLVELEIGAGQ